MPKKLLWLDNKLVEATPTLLESLTPGVLKAKGVFETMRVSSAEVNFLPDHLRRMSRGLKVLGLHASISLPSVRKDMRQLLKMNGLKDARVRLMIWREGKTLHRAIVAQPLEKPTAAQYRKGFSASLTNGHHRQTCVPVKSLDYGIFREGLRKARAAGFDEALFVNHKGELVEGSRTNIFLVKDNCLFTPPIKSGCLSGVMRQQVISAARRLKIHYSAKTLNAEDLFASDEAFVTNALLGIMPLTRLGQKKIGTGKPGPVTRRLCLGLQEFPRRLGNSSDI